MSVSSVCVCSPCLRVPSVLLPTPCIGLAPSAKARMTAVAMLLPGLLLALLAAAIASIAVVRIITPLGRDAVYRGSVADDVSD
ncbi:unnamed protein product [Closterium sp. NIES-64]|nr:unnamed protein product [Closterium sp. NIES-64]